MRRKTPLFLSVAGVALCAAAAPSQATIFDRDVVKVKDLAPQGEDFSAQLAREYREFSLYESGEMLDWPDADYFAEKAFSAVKGLPPEPERVADWNIDGQQHVAELNAAREKLVSALRGGGTGIAPREAAAAQAKFDCWVEQQEEGWQLDHIAACKRDFELAMASLDKAMKPKAGKPAASVETQQESEAKPVGVPTQQSWIVYFDFDKSNIDGTDRKTIDELTALLDDNRDIRLKVTGHADRAGPADYNVDLSERRADAVRAALMEQGLAMLDVNEVDLAAKGETDPAVHTGDGVPEARNRRVVIEAYGVKQVAMESSRTTSDDR